MVRFIVSIIIFILITQNADTQTVSEAVRYSLLQNQSSARSMGVGNALSSLGADLSMASVNPAGIANYRKSEIVFSTRYQNVQIQSGFNNNTFDNDENKFMFSQFGVVFSSMPAGSKWKSFNFAIGMNTLNNFFEYFDYNGDTQGSIVERYKELADGFSPNQFPSFGEETVAYQAGLIYDFEEDDIYESDFTNFQDNVNKAQTVRRSGSVKEIYATLAGTLKNKLSIGFTFGLPIIRYQESKVYTEQDIPDIIPFFINMQAVQELETTGVGMNGKLGLIYKFSNNLRASAFVHSPTIIFLKDVATIDMVHSIQEDETVTFDELSPENNFKYQLTTPMRLGGGLSYLFSAGVIKGFISGDLEWIPYTTNRFNLASSTDNSEDQEYSDELNGYIDDELQSALDFNLGLELGYKSFRIRGGFQSFGDPFKVNLENEKIDAIVSFGVGLRFKKSYLDVAYSMNQSQSDYAPYYISNTSRQPLVRNQMDRNSLQFSVGFKF